MNSDREDWIRTRAHQIWEAEGRPDGRHHERWLSAEHDYAHERGTAAETADIAGEVTEATWRSSDTGTSALP